MKRQNGFVLIEVMLAITIISIGLVAIAGVFAQTTANFASAADYTVAANLAQKQLELLKTWRRDDWNTALAIGEAPWQGEEPEPCMPINLNGVDYIVDTKVSLASVTNSLIEVKVTVSWTRNGKAQNAQFVALYSM